jgi:glutamyl-tRNA(Gln) amidotransferase subunit E
LRLIPQWVEHEALRQQALLELRSLLPKDHAFPLRIMDVTSLASSCESKIIKGVLEKGGKMLGICLPQFHALLGKEVQPNRRVGTELSDYAKVAAGVGGIIHSDEQLEKYGLSPQNVQALRSALHCTTKDAFVLVCAPEGKARKALEAVHKRALMCAVGIPKEVRQPLPDGNSSYMRPIPGADRMYPETDCKSVLLHPDSVSVPPLLDEQKKQFAKKYALPVEQVDTLFHEQKEDLLEELVLRHPSFKPGFVAETLVSLETELQRKEKLDTSKITHEHYRQIFVALEEKRVSKESLLALLTQAAKTGVLDFSAFTLLDQAQVRDIIQNIAQKNAGAPFNVLMGAVMAQLRGKADGALIAKIVKEYVP